MVFPFAHQEQKSPRAMGKAFLHAQEGDGAFDYRSEAGGDQATEAGESDAGAENWGEMDRVMKNGQWPVIRG
jgi:hypothetical protein